RNRVSAGQRGTFGERFTRGAGGTSRRPTTCERRRVAGSAGVTKRLKESTTRSVSTASTTAAMFTQTCRTTPSASACTLVRNDQSNAVAPSTTLTTHDSHHKRTRPDGDGRSPSFRD